MIEQTPSRQIVAQRIRNRIIEHLELTGSFEKQRNYQEAAQIDAPVEIIEQWEDWVPSPDSPMFAVPVFSLDEQVAIATFQRVWEAVSAELPNPLPRLDELVRTPAWERLREAAIASLAVFLIRGKFSDDVESVFP